MFQVQRMTEHIDSIDMKDACEGRLPDHLMLRRVVSVQNCDVNDNLSSSLQNDIANSEGEHPVIGE